MGGYPWGKPWGKPWENGGLMGFIMGFKMGLLILMLMSLDWLKGKITGNNGFYHQIDRAFL